MLADAELNAEEADLNAKVAVLETELRSAVQRLHAISEERLVLHKQDHRDAYETAKTALRALLTDLRALVATSEDVKALTEAARKASNAGYDLSNLFHKATAGEERNWDSPEYRAMEELNHSVQEVADTAEAVAEYLSAAASSKGDRQKLFADTARSLRKGHYRDEGGLPCTGCGQPKWGYNDEGYECRDCY